MNWRLLVAIAFSLIFSFTVHAQNTNVSGAVTDAGGQTWNNGTYTFNFIPKPQFNGTYRLSGSPYTPVAISGSLSATGTFTNVVVPDNNLITPVGTQWTITVCAQTNFICYTSPSITITGASQTITSSITPSAILVTCGSGVNAYADAEVGCGIGGHYYNLTSSSDRVCTAVTGNSCTTWGAAGGGSSLGGTGINAANYGLVSGITIPDATTTSGSNNVSAPNNDGNFTAAMNGYSCFVTNLTSDLQALGAIVILPQTAQTVGTWTTTGAQTGTCSGASGAASTIAGAATLVVAPKMATQLNAAFAAAVANCSFLQLPAGIFLYEAPIFNTGSNACILGSAGTAFSLGIAGSRISSTQLVPSPDFLGTACTGGGNVNICAFAAPGLNARDIAINGMGQSALGAAFSGKILVGMNNTGGANSQWMSMNMLYYGGNTGGSVGFSVTGNCSGCYINNAFVDAFGQQNCYANGGGFVEFIGVICGNYGLQALFVNNVSETFWDIGGIYGQSNLATVSFAAVLIRNGASAYFIGTTIPYTTGPNGGACGLYALDASTLVWVMGARILNGSSAATAGAICAGNATDKIFVRDSWVQGNGASGTAFETFGGSTGGTIVDEGGNVVNGNIAVNNAGNFFQLGYSIYQTGTITNTGVWIGSGSATGTALATGNIGLTSGWGTSSVASVAAGSDSHKGKFTITGAAGAAGPTLTLTFPKAYLVAPSSCVLFETGANDLASLTSVSAGAPSTTTVLFTFVGTPVAVTYVFDYECGP